MYFIFHLQKKYISKYNQLILDTNFYLKKIQRFNSANISIGHISIRHSTNQRKENF